jgi:hypothetical protein
MLSKVILISLSVFIMFLLHKAFNHIAITELHVIIVLQMYSTYFIVKAIELKK